MCLFLIFTVERWYSVDPAVLLGFQLFALLASAVVFTGAQGDNGSISGKGIIVRNGKSHSMIQTSSINALCIQMWKLAQNTFAPQMLSFVFFLLTADVFNN